MKKASAYVYPMILSALFLGLTAFPQQSKADCSWYGSCQEAQQAADDGQSAVNSNTAEGASTYAGYGFDTPSQTPPAVDLSGSQTYTPTLLTNPDGSNPYVPQQYHSLHTTPPPPLP